MAFWKILPDCLKQEQIQVDNYRWFFKSKVECYRQWKVIEFLFGNDTLRTLGCSKILPRTPLLFCQARISVCIQSATRIWNCSVYGLRKTRAERVNFFKAINTAISNSSCWLDTDTYSARENNGVQGSILLLPKVRIILFRFLPAFQTKLFKLFRIGPFH